jgi:hypothetical protein
MEENSADPQFAAILLPFRSNPEKSPLCSGGFYEKSPLNPSGPGFFPVLLFGIFLYQRGGGGFAKNFHRGLCSRGHVRQPRV